MGKFDVMICLRQPTCGRGGVAERKTRISDRHRLTSVLDPVQVTPGKFENTALSLRLGLPFTLIHHENGALQKRSLNWRNLKTPALSFREDRCSHDNHVISLRVIAPTKG